MCLAAWQAPAATFGRVVPIGGEASDLALDEPRGVLYVANFTGNRVDVVSLVSGAVQSAINVSIHPNSLSLSPDGRYLIVGHYAEFENPGTSKNGVTIIEVDSRNRREVALGSPVLGVSFGSDGKALVVTNTQFLRFDPETGVGTVFDTIEDLTTQILPVKEGQQLPAEIHFASVAASADRTVIYGIAGSESTFTFRYIVGASRVLPGGIVVASGLFGPRIVSLNHNGSKVIAGWTLVDERGNFPYYFKTRSNQLGIGTTAFDNARNLIYAQMPEAEDEDPTFLITDGDNMAVLERFPLAENLTGKSVLSSDGSTLYSVSESGVIFFPVGRLETQHRLETSVEDVIFRGDFCDPRTTTMEFTISNPGGGATDFSIRSDTPGVIVTPSNGVTPAKVRVTVDPIAFYNSKGTVTAHLEISSSLGVNLPKPVRVLINNRQPDQRGTFVNVPGVLSDILADPARNRFYILRQDTNRLLVFDGSTFQQVASLKTFNSPTSMAITFDRRYILIGHDSGQAAAVYDLETLTPMPYIDTGTTEGTEAHSIAVSSNAILAAAVDFEGKGRIIRLNLGSLTSTLLPSLGVFLNDELDANMVATASPNGRSIFFASSDGHTLGFNSDGAFFALRQDFEALSGGYGASSYDTYVVGNHLLNASLVPIAEFESSSGQTTGFAFIQEGGFRTSSTGAADPGVIARVDVIGGTPAIVRPTRMAESPIVPVPEEGVRTFTRTIAPLSNGQAIVALTQSGFTVLSASYDAAVAPPVITAVVNAGDLSANLAPGSLISLFGANLSPINIANNEIPLPTALGESCMTVNGMAAPVLFASPNQVNAQLPFTISGNATLILVTPGGISDSINLRILSSAPGIFQANLGPIGTFPTVLRAENNQLVTLSNPVHRGDTLVIFLTGLGVTEPAVAAGQASPASPPAEALITPSVELGGVSLPTDFAGLSPGSVGLYQINVKVLFDVPLGVSIPLVISAGDVTTTVNVRVVD
jgi:uncharacterized protein (TIGR03437 family)